MALAKCYIVTLCMVVIDSGTEALVLLEPE